MADIAGLREKLGQAEAAAANAEAEYARLAFAAKMQNFNLPAQQQEFLAARRAATEFLQNTLNPLRAEVDDAYGALNDAQRTGGDGPRDSAGQEVAQGQRANDDRADTIAPSADAAPAAPPTNADQFEPNQDVNTDAAPRDITATQSLPPITAEPGAAPSRARQQDAFDTTGVISDDSPQATPTQQAGAGASSDDATGGGGNAVVQRINSLFGGEAGRILPRGNALDAYASYTYSISIYLLSPADYRLMLTKKILPKGWQLLVQSAGAPVGGGVIPASQLDPNIETSQAAGEAQLAELGRNQFFSLDYYIDDVSIQHLLPNRGTGSPHSSTEIKFKIYEPNGLTFLPNLYKAVQQYVALRGGVSNQVYTSQNFLMAIRWYGYDRDGNLVTASNTLDQQTATDGTILQKSSKATIEKFIPFQFTEVKFRIQNKIVEYDCSAVCPQNLINTGSARGTIPYNIELSSQSLRDLLTGPTNFVSGTKSGGASGQVVDTGDETQRLLARYPAPSSVSNPAPVTAAKERYNPRRAQVQGSSPATAPQRGPNSDADAQSGGFYGSPSPDQSPAPPKADAASRAASLTISQGLQDALNKYQAEISGPGADKPQEYPDIYEIEIAEDVIANATIVPPGLFNPRQSAMIKAQTARESKDGETQSVDTNSKTTKIRAGLSVVQAIDQAVRQSSYILSQQKYWIDSVSGKTVENATPAQTVGWFRIGLQAEPTDKYDTKRNDYAYRIKYSVAAYQVNDVKSDYFPRTDFRGRHKLYPYWFTGENTQVLKFEQSFNTLYYITQNAKSRPKRTSNYLEADRFYYQTLTSESSQGQDNMKVYDGAASASSWLYSPSDQAECKLDIVGDPAWIFQGEVAFGIQDLKINYSNFLADGTINPQGQEILFEVIFNQPIDYDLSTGLMDAGKFNFGTDRSAREAGLIGTSPAGLPRERYIYQARTCTTYLRQGKFTQELQGLLKTFPLEDPKPEARARDEEKRVGAINANQEAAQVRKIDNAIAAQQSAAPQGGPPPAPTFAQRQAEAAAKVQSARRAQLGLETPTPQSPAAEPTSGTQAVGVPDQSSAETNRLLGTARGPGVGVPSTTLTLDDGSQVTIRSQSQINALRQGGFATAQAASAATERLNLAQQAANNPNTAAKPQIMAKER